MTALQPIDAVPAPTPVVSETANILSMIERVASNPSVDMDRFERLLDMQERILARNAQANFDAALALMQSELPAIEERGEIRHDRNNRNTAPQSTYALWEDVNEVIKPILARHGFALSFKVTNGDGIVSVTGVLAGHGHREETTLKLPVDGSGSKNAVQAVGSSTSYGKRYTAGLLLNLTSRGADDDGQAAGGAERINEHQIGEVTALMDEVGADRDRFLNHLKLGGLHEITVAGLPKVIAALEAKRRARK